MPAELRRIAYLGPPGTHSEHALIAALPGVERLPCHSIAEVFDCVARGAWGSDSCDGGFVPVENKLHGPITETLDLLFHHQGSVFIRRAFLAEITNALGALPPDGPDRIVDVREVFSHEQPLRQCAQELRQLFPRAILVPMASTGAAIAHVLERGLRDAAVIAPLATLQSQGFRIIQDNVSDIADNKTRFVLLHRGAVPREVSSNYPDDDPRLGNQLVTSIVVNPGRDRRGLLFEVLDVISVRHGINLLSIHSRPDRRGGFVFHFDLEGLLSDERIRLCIEELDRYCVDETGRTVEIGIFGSYRREPFDQTGLRSVAVIGGNGVMGRWFRDFFSSSGLDVRSYDLDGKSALKDTVERADAIVLSVPMGAISSVVSEISPYLEPGQLVVENCSIKECALPELERLPSGVETLGIHTMFGPNITSLRGQNVVVTRTGRSGRSAAAFADLFYKYGARITEATAEEHDRSVSLTQAAVQCVLLAFSSALGSSVESLTELDAVTTPNFRLLLDAAKRVLAQNAELTHDLQERNTFATMSRHRLLESLFAIVTALDRGDEAALGEAIERGRKLLPPD